MEELMSHVLFIGKGVALTLQLLAGGLLLGFSLAVVISILRYRGFGVAVIDRWVSVLRGTPLILQLAFVYFALPGVLGIKFSVLAAGILTFGLNASAYIAEILRSGIESLPPGQFEASRTLEIPNFYMWKDIILPQVLRNVFPAMVNEVIALLKETALIGTISGLDIMRMAQILGAERFTYFLPLCIAGAYYYLLVLLIEHFGRKVEKRGFYAQA
ncbi:amino acid ABC transporter permease [Haematospirillum jordaniae]|uniref:Glutamine ABC transporter permease n=2 Tax=Haematospirillum jordaniae TaxID=1549855 RepID=A0A143DFB4_9PROT|nr:glutamine ABC transporter permease [Haematospirillum jordaniae]NKD45562.1 amino acid ABC transporter permease [Haematospirillum jordaniae]NKD56142.1 amino acid ABC transporter permease [Haematospirillum jordaniae]NKD58200.1 amino acid ABC transporter permease [Haematospirillum jordaniae]NKD66629.1 amino acid ABC transporter permease [Haematospirillum jordaniae]